MVERLGWTLVHFVWEGCAVAIVLALALLFTRAATANVRYGLACAALLLLAALPVATFLALTPATVSIGPSSGMTWTAGETILGTARPADERLPLLVQVWAMGVTVLSLRLAGTLLQVERWRRRHARPAEAAWQERLDALARRLGVARPVRFLVSDRIGVPSAWGVLRPLVVLPASLLAGLPPEQVESILLHELAHVRRHDYLVNLAQTVVETILFYHPAVWWVSAVVRREREHCCDDAVVAALGDPMPYARALLHLEERRQILPRPTLSAKEGNLMNRIARILGAKPAPVRLSPLAPVLAALGVAVLVSGGVLQANAQSPKKHSPKAVAKPKKPAAKAAPKAFAKPVPTRRLAPLTKPTLLAKPTSKTAIAIVSGADGRIHALETAPAAKTELWTYPAAIAHNTATVSALATASQKGAALPITTRSAASIFPPRNVSKVTITRDGAVTIQKGARSIGSTGSTSQNQAPASIQGGTVYRRSASVNGPSAVAGGLGVTGQLGGTGGGGFGGGLSSAQGGSRSTQGRFGGIGGGTQATGGGGIGGGGFGGGVAQNAVAGRTGGFGGGVGFGGGGGLGGATGGRGFGASGMEESSVELQNGTVSVDLKDATFATVMRKLAKQGKLSIVIAPGFYEDLTMVLTDQKTDETIEILCRAASATFRRERGVYYIHPYVAAPVQP